jgi:hypothetical protein
MGMRKSLIALDEKVKKNGRYHLPAAGWFKQNIVFERVPRSLQARMPALPAFILTA